MEEKLLKILAEIDEDLLTYTGDNMVGDGLVNSFSFITMVSQIEETFDLDLDPTLLEAEYFGNKDRILKTIKELLA